MLKTLLFLVCASPLSANPYYSLSQSTATGKVTMGISGTLCVASSSNTPTTCNGSTGFIKGNLAVPYHLGVYTVAPGAASTSDKARADFSGDGVDDEVAINSAIAAAGVNNGYVKLLPGNYFLSHPIQFPDLLYNFVFDAEGTALFTITNDTDTIRIYDSQFSKFKFGYINTASSHTAVAIIPQSGGPGFYNNTVSWSQITNGNAQFPLATSVGLLIDNTAAAGNSTNFFYGGAIARFHQGVLEKGSAGDTNIFNINWISLCDIDVDVGNGSATGINSEIWNVNVDACQLTNGPIAIRTGGQNSVFNGMMCALASNSAKSIALVSGASYNRFNLQPDPHQQFPGTITDNSGVTTNGFFPYTTISTPTVSTFALWDASNFQQLNGSNLGQNASGNITLNNSAMLVLANSSSTVNGAVGYNQSTKDLTVGNSVSTQTVHIGAWTTWTPSYSGFSANPTATYAKYTRVGRMVTAQFYSGGYGTSNATTYTITLPVAAASLVVFAGSDATDNGSTQTAPCFLATTAGSTTLTAFKTLAAGAWTNTGSKNCDFSITYEANSD